MMNNLVRLMTAAMSGRSAKCFDWDAAAAVIVDNEYPDASAGLQEDWGNTGRPIFVNGQPVNDGAYVASLWATPILVIFAFSIECWIDEAEAERRWGGERHEWPESALAILGEGHNQLKEKDNV